ncbi:hypothetical protein COV19_01070 [Candidatus Woesearchaeota archaeon CG10_big_fil_rev_8_21_14_0_10_44_13]|nr:MAG: hypothetical protein COV19_01070 [Candidatus Woesearchaeota archaeon CG10_big_fil_rev_8_21_14_0_10_44_13]
MKKRYAFIGLFLLITAAIAMIYGCSKEEVQMGQSPAVDSQVAGSVVVTAVVTDKDTQKPIEGAVVYVGNFYKCHTDSQGKCAINDVPARGSYSLGVFKGGYGRYQTSTMIFVGDNEFAVILEKKSETPSSLTIEGEVVEIVDNKGSRSENRYLKIRADDGKEEYIFDELGSNEGFEEFIDKKVRITGFKETGFIGWQHTETEGIYVESIEKIGMW